MNRRTITHVVLLAILLSSGMAFGYELKAFEGKSRKAILADFMPKIDRGENKDNKFYIEQYSFDAKIKGGYDFWFQIVLSNMGVANGKGAVQVHFKPKGGKKIKAGGTFDRSKWSYKKDGDKLVMDLGGNHFEGNGDTWSGHFETDKFDADIKIKNAVSPWRPGGGTAYYGGKDKYYDINILTPRGTFELDVTLKSTGEKTHLTGAIYGDHSVSNLAPNHQARRWVKMRIVSRAFTLIVNTFESTEMYGNKWGGYFLVVSDKKVVATGTHPRMELSDFDVDQRSGYKVPKLILFSDAKGVDGFQGVIKAIKMVGRHDRLAELSSLARAVVGKFVKPVGFKYKSKFEFEMQIGGKKKSYKGKGNYDFNQVIP